MRSISFVGAGHSSLQLACGLVPHGYDVTIYTDAPAERVLEVPVRATAIMYDRALAHEREVGLNLWDDRDVWSDLVHVDYCLKPGRRLLVMEGALERPIQTIDTRLKYAAWMSEFERRGGRLVVREIGRDDLDELAAGCELLIIASGKQAASLGLFDRDPRRSRYDDPQRKLTLLTVSGVAGPDSAGRTVVSTLTERDGEIFRVPFYDKDAGRAVNILFEARPGQALDRFDGVTAGDVVARAREVIHAVAPWDDEAVERMELVGPLAWSQGAVTPTVLRPVARLPSGQAVLAIGDAVIVHDPVGAQGSNTASKLAHFLTGRIVARGSEPFDAEWMQAAFDDFWESEGCYAVALSNMMLEPLTPAAREFVLAATRAPAVAAVWFEGFNDPPSLFPWIERRRATRERLRRLTGVPWWRSVLPAYGAIVKRQFADRRQTRADARRLSAPG